MQLYYRLTEGIFLERMNRFVARCLINGAETVCHVKNTGRLRELLLPGRKVYLEKALDPTRKTAYDLVGVQAEDRVINIDSQAPNAVFAEWAKAGGYLPNLSHLKAETVFGQSRFDFSFEQGGKQGFCEIKGVTLFDENNLAVFPDAPTERGVKHLHELIVAQQEGYLAGICFLVQRVDAVGLRPNDSTHPAFGEALRAAKEAGVSVEAVACRVTEDSVTVDHRIPIHL